MFILKMFNVLLCLWVFLSISSFQKYLYLYNIFHYAQWITILQYAQISFAFVIVKEVSLLQKQ